MWIRLLQVYWLVVLLDWRCEVYAETRDVPTLTLKSKSNGKIDPDSLEFFATTLDDAGTEFRRLNKGGLTLSEEDSSENIEDLEIIFQNRGETDVDKVANGSVTAVGETTQNVDNLSEILNNLHTTTRRRVNPNGTNGVDPDHPSRSNNVLLLDMENAASSNIMAKFVSMTDDSAKDVVENVLGRDRSGETAKEILDVENVPSDLESLNVVTEISVKETVDGLTVHRKPTNEELRRIQKKILGTSFEDSTSSTDPSQNTSGSHVVPADVEDLATFLKADASFADDESYLFGGWSDDDEDDDDDDHDDINDMESILREDSDSFDQMHLDNRRDRDDEDVDFDENNGGDKTKYIVDQKSVMEKEPPLGDYRKVFLTERKNFSNVKEVKIVINETEGDFFDDDDVSFPLLQPSQEAKANADTIAAITNNLDTFHQTTTDASIVTAEVFPEISPTENEVNFKSITTSATTTTTELFQNNISSTELPERLDDISTDSPKLIVKNITNNISELSKDNGIPNDTTTSTVLVVISESNLETTEFMENLNNDNFSDINNNLATELPLLFNDTTNSVSSTETEITSTIISGIRQQSETSTEPSKSVAESTEAHKADEILAENGVSVKDLNEITSLVENSYHEVKTSDTQEISVPFSTELPEKLTTVDSIFNQIVRVEETTEFKGILEELGATEKSGQRNEDIQSNTETLSEDFGATETATHETIQQNNEGTESTSSITITAQILNEFVEDVISNVTPPFNNNTEELAIPGDISTVKIYDEEASTPSGNTAVQEGTTSLDTLNGLSFTYSDLNSRDSEKAITEINMSFIDETFTAMIESTERVGDNLNLLKESAAESTTYHPFKDSGITQTNDYKIAGDVTEQALHTTTVVKETVIFKATESILQASSKPSTSTITEVSATDVVKPNISSGDFQFTSDTTEESAATYTILKEIMTSETTESGLQTSTSPPTPTTAESIEYNPNKNEHFHTEVSKPNPPSGDSRFASDTTQKSAAATTLLKETVVAEATESILQTSTSPSTATAVESIESNTNKNEHFQAEVFKPNPSSGESTFTNDTTQKSATATTMVEETGAAEATGSTLQTSTSPSTPTTAESIESNTNKNEHFQAEVFKPNPSSGESTFTNDTTQKSATATTMVEETEAAEATESTLQTSTSPSTATTAESIESSTNKNEHFQAEVFKPNPSSGESTFTNDTTQKSATATTMVEETEAAEATESTLQTSTSPSTATTAESIESNTNKNEHFQAEVFKPNPSSGESTFTKDTTEKSAAATTMLKETVAAEATESILQTSTSPSTSTATEIMESSTNTSEHLKVALVSPNPFSDDVLVTSDAAQESATSVTTLKGTVTYETITDTEPALNVPYIVTTSDTSESYNNTNDNFEVEIVNNNNTNHQSVITENYFSDTTEAKEIVTSATRAYEPHSISQVHSDVEVDKTNISNSSKNNKEEIDPHEITPSEVESLFNSKIEEYEDDDYESKEYTDKNNHNFTVWTVFGAQEVVDNKEVDDKSSLTKTEKQQLTNENTPIVDHFDGYDFMATIGGSRQKVQLVPILRTTILNNSAEFSVKISKKNDTFYIPVSAYVKEYGNIINITWRTREKQNNSVAMRIFEKEDFYMIKEITINVFTGNRFITEQKPVAFNPDPILDDTMLGRTRLVMMRDGTYITLSNVEFLKKVTPSVDEIRENNEAATRSQKLWHFELAFICVATVVIVAIVLCVVAIKTKAKISLGEKDQLPQVTHC